MLKEFLPKLSLRKKRNPIHETVDTPDSEPDLLTSYTSSIDKGNINFIHQAVSSLRIFILAVPLIFIGSLAYSDILDMQISGTKKRIETLNQEIIQYRNFTENYERIYKKAEIYKKIRSVDPPLSYKTEWIVSQVPGEVRLIDVIYRDNAYHIKAESSDALGISLLIYSYFRDPSVSEIVLQSASKDNRSSFFITELGVVYR